METGKKKGREKKKAIPIQWATAWQQSHRQTQRQGMTVQHDYRVIIFARSFTRPLQCTAHYYHCYYTGDNITSIKMGNDSRSQTTTANCVCFVSPWVSAVSISSGTCRNLIVSNFNSLFPPPPPPNPSDQRLFNQWNYSLFAIILKLKPTWTRLSILIVDDVDRKKGVQVTRPKHEKKAQKCAYMLIWHDKTKQIMHLLFICIFRYSVFRGWARGPWGRDPFNSSDLWSGTLFLSLSLSGIFLHFLKSKLKTHDFSLA